MKLSAVIAAYDERDNIEELTRRLDRVLRDLPEHEAEMIFAVEGRDGTREILERLASEFGRIRILYNEKPSGLGAAFRRGFAAVAPDADLVVTLDADLNHRPEEIPRLLEELERRDADVLVGSRFVAGARSDGIPLWKRALSGIMNKIIGTLFDVEILDKTSGFRVYRAAALSRLTGYRNENYAFLPEMLIQATALGLHIAEAPIHFTFRTRGKSKMSMPQTSRSYLLLLRSRFDRLSAAALLLLGIGATIRALYAYPTHKFVPDADSLLTGLRALDILEGKLRVFYSYVRIGALESYMHAPAIRSLGVTRSAISIAPLFSGVATLFFFFFFVREILGRETAVAALLFLAVPSPAYMAWSYMPNGYPETLLLCVVTLYLAARTARTGHRNWSSMALGLSVGLGVWQSVQTLTCAAPALMWLFWRRPGLLRGGRFLAVGAAGLIIGASPWLGYNVVHPWATFHGNYAVQFADGPSIASNTKYFVSYDLRELLAGTHPSRPPTPFTRFGDTLWIAAVASYALAFLALFLEALRPSHGSSSRPRQARSGAALLLLVAITIAALDVVSAAGQGRGLTVRYALPFFFVAAAALGAFVRLLWNRRLLAATAVAGVVLLLHLACYDWPWTAHRRYLREVDRQDRALVAYLESKGIQWVCGNYWTTYPLNFLSARRITGVPFPQNADHYGYEKALPDDASGWGLVAVQPTTLPKWLEGIPLDGHIERVANRFFVFLPSNQERDRWKTGPLIAALQSSAPNGF